MTECECRKPGWCERHQCYKTAHWHELCKTREDYFQLWEQGRGPGQKRDTAAPGRVIPTKTPALARRALNLAKALVRHLADGRRKVDDTTYETRLQICEACPSCDRQRMVCRERDCGCRLKIKAKWRSEDCPIGKWPWVRKSEWWDWVAKSRFFSVRR